MPGFSASRQAAPARGSCCGGRPFGPTALRCSHRGRADNSLRASPCGPGATLRQYRRVSSRSALARADPGAALLVAAEIAPAGCRLTRGRGRGGVRVQHHERCRKAGPGRPRCACEAPRSAGPMASARSAPPPLTSSRLSERSERSSRSELATRPWDRAPQGSRRSRPPNRSVAACPGPALLAPTPARRIQLCAANEPTASRRNALRFHHPKAASASTTAACPVPARNGR